MSQDHIEVAMSPKDAASAVSSPFGLGIWLADEARGEAKPDGRVNLWWHNGDYAVGRWTEFSPPESLELSFDRHPTWIPAQLRFSMVPTDHGSRIEITSGGNNELIEGLRVYIESGASHRERQRPMMGISFEEVEDDPDGRGLRVTSLVDGGGAQAAGIKSGDIVTAVNGKTTMDWPSMATALQDLKAGQTVEIRVRRDGAESAIPVTLQPRPEPPVPETSDGVMRLAEESVLGHLRGLRELLNEATEELAAFRPENEWSVKEVMAHVVVGERFSFEWVASAAHDHSHPDWSYGVEDSLRQVYQTWPLADVWSAYRLTLNERLGSFRELLAEDLPARKLRTIAMDVHHTAEHLDEHLDQIRSTLEQARAGSDDWAAST